MKKLMIAATAGLLATAAFAQVPAPAPRITTPEGAQMDSADDIAYKPGQLTQEQLMSSTRSLFRQNAMNVFRRFPADKTAQMVKFYTEALALKSLNPIQLTSTQQMLLTNNVVQGLGPQAFCEWDRTHSQRLIAAGRLHPWE